MAQCEYKWATFKDLPLPIKEQLLNFCYTNLAVHLKEQNPKNLEYLVADSNLQVHDLSLVLQEKLKK